MMPTGIVVIVSAFFALIGIIISKENKVSEFRQKWIDELRVEISTIIAYSLKINAITSTIVEINSQINLADNTLRSVKTIQANYLTQSVPPSSYQQSLTEQEIKQAQDELKELKKHRMDRIKALEDQFLVTGQSVTSVKLRMNKEDEFLSQLTRFDIAFTTLRTAILNPNWNGWMNPLASNEAQNFSTEIELFTKISKKLLKSEWERVKKGEKVFYWTTRTLFIAVIIAVLFFGISEIPIKKLFSSDSVSKSEITLRVIEEAPGIKPESTNTK